MLRCGAEILTNNDAEPKSSSWGNGAKSRSRGEGAKSNISKEPGVETGSPREREEPKSDAMSCGAEILFFWRGAGRNPTSTRLKEPNPDQRDLGAETVSRERNSSRNHPSIREGAEIRISSRDGGMGGGGHEIRGRLITPPLKSRNDSTERPRTANCSHLAALE
jgi:hypothetical protein